MSGTPGLVVVHPLRDQQPLNHRDKLSGDEIALHWEGLGPRLGATTAWVSLIRMSPGNASTFHVHPTNDEFFVVVEGRGAVRDGTPEDFREYPIGQYSIVMAPEGVAKQIVNTGEEPLVLIQVYAPAPDALEHEQMLRDENIAVHLDGRS